jgi:hypothetical protein
VNYRRQSFFAFQGHSYNYLSRLFSIVQLSLAALPHLKKTNGNVLNISSVGSVKIS